jgi:hypothetical protein
MSTAPTWRAGEAVDLDRLAEALVSDGLRRARRRAQGGSREPARTDEGERRGDAPGSAKGKG